MSTYWIESPSPPVPRLASSHKQEYGRHLKKKFGKIKCLCVCVFACGCVCVEERKYEGGLNVSFHKTNDPRFFFCCRCCCLPHFKRRSRRRRPRRSAAAAAAAAAAIDKTVWRRKISRVPSSQMCITQSHNTREEGGRGGV